MSNRIHVVEFTKFAAKQASRLPKEIKEALFFWKESVEHLGLPEVRKCRGYHDEPLKGQRAGQRSVRLNFAFTVIYEVDGRNRVAIVGVKAV